jgi:hypothetical protein
MAAASWASASWAVSTFEDGAAGELGIGGLILTLEEEQILAQLESTDPTTP